MKTGPKPQRCNRAKGSKLESEMFGPMCTNLFPERLDAA